MRPVNFLVFMTKFHISYVWQDEWSLVFQIEPRLFFQRQNNDLPFSVLPSQTPWHGFYFSCLKYSLLYVRQRIKMLSVLSSRLCVLNFHNGSNLKRREVFKFTYKPKILKGARYWRVHINLEFEKAWDIGTSVETWDLKRREVQECPYKLESEEMWDVGVSV
jgi:hypothetical protein